MTEDFGKMLTRLACRRYGKYLFKAHCPVCSEPVEGDDTIDVSPLTGLTLIDQPNATCAVHGRVKMPYAGEFLDELADRG